MRTLLPFILVLPLVAACGRGFSDTQSDGGTHHPGTDAGDDDDDDTDAGSDAGCGPAPAIPVGSGCQLPCGGGYAPPVCSDGQWVCPSYEGVACPASCHGEGPIACSTPVGCPPDVFEVPVCTDAGWTCELSGPCDPWGPDGGIEDASPDVWVGPDANPPPAYFSCGDLACDANTTYCQITTGGAVTEDGGVSSGYQCIPLPSSCASGAVDCACVQAFQGIGCGCVNGPSNEVIVTCDIP